MFTILQLSDIHFVEDAELDVNAELSDAVLAFASEIRGRFGEVDVIVVCGDVAYSGLQEQYVRASTFLRNLEVALGSPRILVVPGNHDVHLPTTDGADQNALRSLPRRQKISGGERDRQLNTLLKGQQSGSELLEPLRSYLNFASEYGCTFDSKRPFWEIGLPISPRLEARFRGLTSVLVSDANDKRDKLLLGRLQTAAIKAHEPGIFNITICHHAFEWLLDGDDQRNIIDNRSPIHMSGHDHRQALRKTPCGLHLQAGAMQPDRSEDDWESRLNVITVDPKICGTRAISRLEVHPAVWEPTLDRFVWELGPPQPFFASTEVKQVELSAVERDRELARLERRLANLSLADRFHVAVEADLDHAALAEMSESAIVAAMIEEANLKDDLGALWNAVERRHGNQERRENPFT